MTRPLWECATIVGCGLIGASFALALKESGACRRIAGWDSAPGVLEEALRAHVIDEADESFVNGRVSPSDLVYLATPVGGIIDFLRDCGPALDPCATVTDAGSTKVEVGRAARGHMPEGVLFVGGHPVAGSLLTGLAHARADLFRGAPYVLTECAGEDDPRRGRRVAARTIRDGLPRHDEARGEPVGDVARHPRDQFGPGRRSTRRSRREAAGPA